MAAASSPARTSSSALALTAAIGAIPGLAECGPMTHIDALELDVVPRHLLILGAGFVGLEFAQAMRRFGAEVTVIDRNDRVLHGEDEDISAEPRGTLRR